MHFGYKSEIGAVYFALVALSACFLVPRRVLPAVGVAWALGSRLVARGAYNRARPLNDAGPGEKESARFVISRHMPLGKRPIAIVTGTNSGIGFETAIGLAIEGYVVVTTCRSASLTKKTAERICAEVQRRRSAAPQKYAHSPVDIVVDGSMPLECDDFESIRAFVAWMEKTYGNRNVQVLVNNAGGMRGALEFSKFHPELEFHTAVNFLGPLLLTELLLPLLEKNGGRVVYVSSSAHRVPELVLERGWLPVWWKSRNEKSMRGIARGRVLQALKDLNKGAQGSCGPLSSKKNSVKSAFVRYGTSKLLNTYHAHVIALRYKDVKDERHRVYACSLHPGCVATNFSRDLLFGVVNTIFQYVSLTFLKSCRDGAQTSLHCAMCPREELELITFRDGVDAKDAECVSPYFVECREKTKSVVYAYGWDTLEAENIVNWGRHIVGLQ